jgi:hypothetical protein
MVMKKELSWVRRFQKQAIEVGTVLADKTSLTLDEEKSGLKKLDDKHAITDKLKKTGDTIAVLAQQVDQRLELYTKAGIVIIVSTEVVSRVGEESA